MNTLASLIPVLLFVFLSSVALARVGETPQQCETRYGKPTEQRDDGTTVYEVNSRQVCVVFDRGKAVKIEYRVDSDNEAFELLKRNHAGKWEDAGTQKFEVLGVASDRVIFKSSDGMLKAVLNRGYSSLIVMSIAWSDAQDAKNKAEERAGQDKALEGL